MQTTNQTFFLPGVLWETPTSKLCYANLKTQIIKGLLDQCPTQTSLGINTHDSYQQSTSRSTESHSKMRDMTNQRLSLRSHGMLTDAFFAPTKPRRATPGQIDALDSSVCAKPFSAWKDTDK